MPRGGIDPDLPGRESRRGACGGPAPRGADRRADRPDDRGDRPGADQAWFFKAVGPREAIDPAADEIADWLQSVRIEDGRPVWETPDGWAEEPGGGMRLATLRVPTPGGGSTELSVIGLGLSPDWPAQVLDNVNRWRKQLQLPPLSAASEAGEPLDDVAEGAVLFDAVGWFEGGSMAPFAGGATTPPPIVQNPPAGQELKYQTPDGWTEDAGASPIRRASLTTDGGAEVTAFAFPAAGAMSDPLENANRWRREIGLEPLEPQQLEDKTETIELLGAEGSYFEFVGEEQATSAAMAQLGDRVWFFKLRGAKDEVAAQGDAFREWLASLSL